MTASLSLRWQAFQLGKQGNAIEDYEDANASDPATGRFAIADGASEASFAAVWARLLVTRFVGDPGKPWRSLDWVRPLRQDWAEQVDALNLPWYAEQKRDLGAFATFLGVVFQRGPADTGGTWQALAVGDCCLFHARRDRLLASFPLTCAADFGNRPRLLGSRPVASRGGEAPEAADERAHGKWQPTDRFLLMTDALAQWLLLRAEQGEEPLVEIRALLADTCIGDLSEEARAAAFAAWVDERRQQSVLRNDDVTLIVVDVEPGSFDP